MYRQLTLISVLLLLISSAIQATEVNVGYDSRYVSEGRNQLSLGGIYWINGAQDLTDNITLNIAYGLAAESQANYDELNIAVQYSNVIAGINYALSYTRLEFFKDNESDDEITLGLSYNQAKLLTPFSNIVYSAEANGVFVEVGGITEFLVNERVSISPYILVAYDFGYAGGQEDGYNHSSIGASLSFVVSDSLAVSGIVEKTFGGNIIKMEDDKAEQLWTGMYLTYNW